MRFILYFLAAMTMLVASSHCAGATPTLDDLWKVVQGQQQQITALRNELDATRLALGDAVSKVDAAVQQAHVVDSKIAAVDAKVEMTADALEQGEMGAGAGEQANVAKAAASWTERTTLGGYGELHYNRLDDDATADDGAEDDLDRVDLHRFVLFAGHSFNDWLRFASELEVEHGRTATGTTGEVKLELARLEMDVTSRHHLRAGVDILPIGILNSTHEPNTFYGVERNPVETEIVPSTWTEASLGATGELGRGFAYDVYLHSGLVVPLDGARAFHPRSGRLTVTEADDQDAAVLGRIIYAGIPGLQLAAAVDYQTDYTGTADAIDADAWLVETHLDWRHRSGLALRALYARWQLGGDGVANIDPARFNADVLDGWYVEPAYRFALAGVLPGELGIFGRYQSWDERNLLAGARYRFEAMDMFTVGMNYWPHPQVVFKFDAQWQNARGPVDRERDGINLGVGYQF